MFQAVSAFPTPQHTPRMANSNGHLVGHSPGILCLWRPRPLVPGCCGVEDTCCPSLDGQTGRRLEPEDTLHRAEAPAGELSPLASTSVQRPFSKMLWGPQQGRTQVFGFPCPKLSSHPKHLLPPPQHPHAIPEGPAGWVDTAFVLGGEQAKHEPYHNPERESTVTKQSCQSSTASLSQLTPHSRSYSTSGSPFQRSIIIHFPSNDYF